LEILPRLVEFVPAVPEFVYLGSANITHGGLETNRELCEIIDNEYESVEGYVTNELDYTL